MNSRRQFRCKNDGRRRAVKTTTGSGGEFLLNGIDYLEVDPDPMLQHRLTVYFIHNLPVQSDPELPTPVLALNKGNFKIEGGVRIKNIMVIDVTLDKPYSVTVELDTAGDFSMYTLRVVDSPTSDVPPNGFDTELSAVEFSFKVNCPSQFDCKAEQVCPSETYKEPEIDYLAKDYSSFRRLMLDRLSVIMPDWKERNAADLQMALVELLAYTGDHLSYYQDAVSTESYLGTARRRISLRRHARLLDYFVHDGCNARTWVTMEVTKNGAADGLPLKAGTVLLTRDPNQQGAISTKQFREALLKNPVVFETLHDITLDSAHNRISFYTWSDSECCLPVGSTRATLVNDPSLSLTKGDVLIFEEIVSPTTGTEADADPRHRHAVRLETVTAKTDILTGKDVLEIQWYEEDALPFPLCLTASISSGSGLPQVKEISVARGNVVAADHGLTLSNRTLVPDSVPFTGHYRPRIQDKNITFRVRYQHSTSITKSASSVMVQDPHHALPFIYLMEDGETWSPQWDLLGSDRFATEFVVEVERDRTARLRFGDNVSGKKPEGGFSPSVWYRVGSGRTGNVGAEAIGRVVLNTGGIANARNPLPAVGGTEPETMEEIRQFAPQAFRTQKRAVTEADYAAMTQLHPEVQKAAARFRWTGSWYTVFITVDRKGGFPVDIDFKEDICSHLEQYRMAGYDLEIRGPVYVPMEIVANVCVKPGYFKSHVQKSLYTVFSRFSISGGGYGFFHPDQYTFGTPVYLSAFYQRAMAVDGVASLEVKKFQRWGKIPNMEKENGRLEPAEMEIIRLDNDPNFPENGKIEFLMFGGV